MGWKLCLTHATLGILSYIFLIMAGIGGGVFIYVENYTRIKELPKLHKIAQRIRITFNLSYLIIGFLLLTVTLVLGFRQAKEIWKETILNTKTISSSLIWLYYLSLFIINGWLRLKKNKKTLHIFSLLSVIGIPLLLLNFLIGNIILVGRHNFF